MWDITKLLSDWPYVPDEVTVRLVEGQDGKQKIQMRLDLGLLQMEFEGRPDGKQPHGFDSLLEYYENKRSTHIKQFGSDMDFVLSEKDCNALRSESLQFYYRYLSLFHLHEYQGVARDTARNLRVFDFIKKYAADEEDRYALEQYRPYVIMMYTRSRAALLMDESRLQEAKELVEEGIYKIRRFFKDMGRPQLAKRCSEMIILKELRSDIIEQMDEDPIQRLRKEMQEAVTREDYECAAYLRDEIKRLQTEKSNQIL